MSINEISNYVQSELLKRDIQSAIENSIKSTTKYIVVKNMPNIRISDHISKKGYKSYFFNLMKNGKTNIFIREDKPIFYYSFEDVDKLINSYESLYKKRNLN